MDFEEIRKKLEAEMPYHIKPKAIYPRGDGWVALARGYVSRQDVQKRLDDVLGVEGWEAKFKVIDQDRKIVECTLTMITDKKEKDGYPIWVSRSDVGAPQGEDEGDQWKGAYSDSFKRAATMFGVGRFLYNLDAKFLPCEVKRDRDGQIIYSKVSGKPIFSRWITEPEAGSPPPETAYTNEDAPVEPEGPMADDVASIVQDLEARASTVGGDTIQDKYVVTCKVCQGTRTEVRMTSGKGKRPAHMAVWCKNPDCSSQGKYRGYSYPLTEIDKHSPKRAAPAPPTEEIEDDLPF